MITRHNRCVCDLGTVSCRGVRFAEYDFGSVLLKRGFRLGFGFTKLTVVEFFGSAFTV